MTVQTTSGTRTILANGVRVIANDSVAARLAAIKSRVVKATGGTGGQRGRAAPWREIFNDLRPGGEMVIPYTPKGVDEHVLFNGHDMPTFGGVVSGAKSYFEKTGRNIKVIDMRDGTATLLRVDDGSCDTNEDIGLLDDDAEDSQ